MEHHEWSTQEERKLQTMKKQGKSYAEIAEVLKVSQRSVANKINDLIQKGWDLKYKRQFRIDKAPPQLQLAATTLYWAEGTKTGRAAEIANTDAELIKIVKKWLETLGVQKEEFKIRIKGVEDDEQWWSKELGVPLTQFQKRSPYKKSKSSFPSKPSEHGICTLRVYNKELKELIMRFVHAFREVWVEQLLS